MTDDVSLIERVKFSILDNACYYGRGSHSCALPVDELCKNNFFSNDYDIHTNEETGDPVFPDKYAYMRKVSIAQSAIEEYDRQTLLKIKKPNKKTLDQILENHRNDSFMERNCATTEHNEVRLTQKGYEYVDAIRLFVVIQTIFILGEHKKNGMPGLSIKKLHHVFTNVIYDPDESDDDRATREEAHKKISYSWRGYIEYFVDIVKIHAQPTRFYTLFDIDKDAQIAYITKDFYKLLKKYNFKPKKYVELFYEILDIERLSYIGNKTLQPMYAANRDSIEEESGVTINQEINVDNSSKVKINAVQKTSITQRMSDHPWSTFGLGILSGILSSGFVAILVVILS